jgi:signal transduction histidine kinase/CheY-like chemotaxis protein
MASWLSARNLRTALAWVWDGYERARLNAEVARQRAGELRRALKALDEATHRLERTNYMLALARDQAEEARRLKQHFAQTISHELRTPINLVVGFTELMTESPDHYGSQLPPAYLRDLSIVHRNASHLQNLVSDVLDLARIDAAQMSVLPEDTDPVDLVEDAVSTVRGPVEARGLALHTEIEADLPRLCVDPTRIRQVLFNLLNNAARFTDEGSITVSVCRRGDDVVFAVADTGVGIAPENISRVFEEFEQVDGGTRRRYGGAGLGLAISKRFVEMHGGRIWAESQVGQGSTFYFSLSVGRADLAATAGRLADAVSSATPGGGEGPVLLAVARSPAAAALLTRYVRGFRTVVVPDLEQARRVAQRVVPQAVVIDRACVALNSDRLERLAQEWGVSHLPFIACPLPGEELLRQQLAVDGYLIKPVMRRTLRDVLRQCGEDVDQVLVIDDDQDFTFLMSRMLEDSPVRRYQVLSAYSGQEGLGMMRRHQPDLVLLDLGLPDMHGLQVIECIRSNPTWQHIPIVIVSAQDELDNNDILMGSMMIAKADGVLPGEVVRWVQGIVNTTVTPLPARQVPKEVPVL